MSFKETVLLVEPDNVAVRTVTVTQRGVTQVIERLHLNPLHPEVFTVRTWRNTHDERDLTGQMRVFREVLPEPPKEEAEDPIFQDLKIKEPLELFPKKES